MGDAAVCEEALVVDLMETQPVSEHNIETDIDVAPSKEQAKEVSHEDIRSEVSNPVVSPKENTSTFHDVTSQPVEILCSSNAAALVDDTSVLSGNSSSTETVSDASPIVDTSLAVSTSHVTLEIPKHLSSTGVRKITFKFSKKKEDYESRPMALVVGNAFVDCSSSSVCSPNMELKMSKKVLANNFPSNVKKLLATGILDGARVKYISASPERELPGIINGGGYLCGCSSCNFSKVLSAYEFELHAGAKTRHPNNHIYLENGKPVYNIIQEIKTAPLSILDEVVKSVAGSSINEQFFQDWKANLQRGKEIVKSAKKFDTDSPRSASFSKSVEGTMSTSYSSLQTKTFGQERYPETIDWRHVVKKPNSCFTNSVAPQKRNADGGTKKRDNDLHRLLFMPNGLPDGAELAYYVKGHRLLKGYKQGNGIVCDCCDKEVSPSQFESHAGMAARRQPYRHIYISNGLTLHDIALSLANGQRLTSDVSDDMCAICGGGGELLLCCECPQAFHTACLNLQSLPEADWICPNCSNNGHGRKVISGDGSIMAKPIVIRLKRVVKAPELNPGGCAICRAHDFSPEKFEDRTVILCDQCEKEYHVGCLRDSKQCDLKGIPEDKWFCCDDCSRIHLALQTSVSNGLQAVPLTLLSTIRKKHMEKGLLFTDESGDFVQWRILSGKSRSPEHMPLLSGAAAIFRECFDPIVAKSGRDLIPLMVYGRNISGQEFGGMYCVVLIVGSVVVSAGLLRLFGREVAELPLVATSRACQGKGYFQTLFSCIEGLLSSMKVGKLVLPAAEEAMSIWTKKFGFKTINDEQLTKYQGFQLTVFKGTSMLEKEVPVLSE